MAQQISDQLDETTGGMLQAVNMFRPQQFNVVPFEGSWTAAQVVEHLLKSESGVAHFLKGNSKATDSDPEANVSAIESMMLNFDSKMVSPAFVQPSAGVKDAETLLAAFRSNREGIRQMALGIDLTNTFTDFQLPNIGALTGLEWLAFMVSHFKRHIQQLKNIYAHIVDKHI